jgi:hypothetical protein
MAISRKEALGLRQSSTKQKPHFHPLSQLSTLKRANQKSGAGELVLAKQIPYSERESEFQPGLRKGQ